jgi:hypothetical protein
LLQSAGDALIAAIAERQHGVVARWQLLALGFGSRAIESRVKLRRLHSIHLGVYAVGHRKLTVQGRWMAAVLACGPGAVLSHRSAAALLGLLPYSGSRINVTVPARGRRSRPGIWVRTTTRLTAADVTTVDGIPVTSVVRTLIDLAAVVHRDRVVKAIEASERLELFDLRAIDDAIARAPTRKGVRNLKRALAAYRPPPTTKSGLERRVLKELHKAGLPEPLINALLHGEEPDLYWPEARLVVELDGSPYHRSPRELARDRRKDALLTRHGETVLRFTDERLEHDMEGAIADVVALYNRATGASP